MHSLRGGVGGGGGGLSAHAHHFASRRLRLYALVDLGPLVFRLPFFSFLCSPFLVLELARYLPFFLPLVESRFMAFSPTILVCSFLRVLRILELFFSTKLLPLFKRGIVCFFFVLASQISSFLISIRIAFLSSFVRGLYLCILQELQYDAPQ